jgi:hypothetical protein
MDAIDPATGEQLDSYEEHTEREVDEALEQACGAFEDWRERPMRDRERRVAGDTVEDPVAFEQRDGLSRSSELVSRRDARDSAADDSRVDA